MPEQLVHPTREELRAFSLGQLPPADAESVESHISHCAPCCETLLGLSSDDTFVALLQEADQAAGEQTADQPDAAEGAWPEVDTAVPAALDEHPRYRIVELIGQGGMGEVFKAQHRVMERTVALKVINRELVRKPEAVERFHREVKAAARLSHPNIVTAYDAEKAGDVHFLVMEYVDGVDLARLVQQRGPLPIGQACEYVVQAALGLQYAHERGMVHRDIKPHNLMASSAASPGGRPTIKILDFGLASLAPAPSGGAETAEARGDLTAAGAVVGTPDFISPEQVADAHQADIRSDIYSLGATLYYLLCGHAPFARGNVMNSLKDHAEREPAPIETVRIDVPAELAEVIRRMMAKDPAQRFQAPAEIADALAPFVDQHRSGGGGGMGNGNGGPWHSHFRFEDPYFRFGLKLALFVAVPAGIAFALLVSFGITDFYGIAAICVFAVAGCFAYVSFRRLLRRELKGPAGGDNATRENGSEQTFKPSPKDLAERRDRLLSGSCGAAAFVGLFSLLAHYGDSIFVTTAAWIGAFVNLVLAGYSFMRGLLLAAELSVTTQRVTGIVKGESHVYSDCRCITQIRTATKTYTRAQAHELLKSSPGALYVQHGLSQTSVVAATRDGLNYVRTLPNDTAEDKLLGVPEWRLSD